MFSRADVDRVRELADLAERANAPFVAKMRERMTGTQILMQHRAEQDARTNRRQWQQSVDEEGCGAVFAALTTAP